MRRKLNKHPFRDTMQTHIEVTIAGNRVWVHWNDFFISDTPTIFVTTKRRLKSLVSFRTTIKKKKTENKIADDTNERYTIYLYIKIYIYVCMYARIRTSDAKTRTRTRCASSFVTMSPDRTSISDEILNDRYETPPVFISTFSPKPATEQLLNKRDSKP